MDQASHNKIVSFTRLVADVVTSKLDVRDTAARLPDEELQIAREERTAVDRESDGLEEEATP